MATYIDALDGKHTDGSEQEKETTLLETYLASQGEHCPFCDSYHIAAEEFQDEGLTVFRKVKCNSCNKEWDEMFQLEKVYEIKE
jgi:transposase-like protein